DLDVFFRLSTPTAQRIYRFLDKRFYTAPVVAMDLVEFACGHVGLTDAGNVALLKRRLAPAIAELEQIGFLALAEPPERFQKVKPGVWRVHFRAAAPRGNGDGGTPSAPSPPTPVLPAVLPACARALEQSVEADGPVVELAREFYRLWSPALPAEPGPRD